MFARGKSNITCSRELLIGHIGVLIESYSIVFTHFDSNPSVTVI